MIELMKSGNLMPEPETTPSCKVKVPVKLEIVEDSLEEEHGPLNKRSRVSSSLQQQWNTEATAFSAPPSQYNPLDEPSPLGLQLRKSPSLLDLIQMRLAQGSGSNVGAPQANSASTVVKKESKSAAAPGTNEKLKASNFPASLLRIGRWEYKSRYEGDLVAKCYFAKHKLVWEVLEGGLKSKVEIQWSDIMGLKANCPEDGPGTLIVVLARQPLFFRETNPQPRKHTLWQATTDFTDGQASIHRQHFMQCPHGLLNKHFEKLIQCDHRLYHLSRQPEIILDSPCFESRPSIFEDPEESKGRQYGPLELGKGSSFSGSQNLASPAAAQSSSEHLSQEAPSPSSVMDAHAIEGNKHAEVVDSTIPRNWDQIKVPGLHPSMSVSDLMNHLGQCLSEQMNSGSQSSGDASQRQEMIEDIAQYLLSDTQQTTASDEKCLMSRVNSLCCLLQKENITATNLQAVVEGCDGGCSGGNSYQPSSQIETMSDNKTNGDFKDPNPDARDASSSKPGMSRKDSFGELLLHLPRIASLPKFLFNISEEDSDTC